MFGDLQGMMEQLRKAQAKVEETRKRLDTVLVTGESPEAKIKVTVTANRHVKDIRIDDSLLEDREMLEDYMVLAINNALDKANQINESEMAAAAKDGLPDIPGMDMF